MKSQMLFSGEKNKKNIIKLSADFFQSVVKGYLFGWEGTCECPTISGSVTMTVIAYWFACHRIFLIPLDRQITCVQNADSLSSTWLLVMSQDSSIQDQCQTPIPSCVFNIGSLDIQSNLNGSNIFETMEIRSRHG